MCACVCVSLPGLYPDIIIKGDICVVSLFFPGKWVCIVQHNKTNLSPQLMLEPFKGTTDGWYENVPTGNQLEFIQI